MTIDTRPNALVLQHVGKCYHLYRRAEDRLKQFMLGRWKRYFREYWAVSDVTLDVHQGEVLGIVGRNGAGKSTLLQLICGTLHPSHGTLVRNGRVAALLELGAGFNPEFTGRENALLNAALLGMSPAELESRMAHIIAFAEIGDYIDQPVKTYSSGMFVRLAFAVAVHIEPELLVIDEALSVGDGNFAKKSFDRIMAMKRQGKTILFCSHSLYQVEAIADRVLWLDRGEVRGLDAPQVVIPAYKAFLDATAEAQPALAVADAPPADAQAGRVRLRELAVNGRAPAGRHYTLRSRHDDLVIEAEFEFDPELPRPHVAYALTLADGSAVFCCATMHSDGGVEELARGRALARLTLPAIQLMRGNYWVYVALMGDEGVHVYEEARMAAEIRVVDESILPGYAHLPHRWGRNADVPVAIERASTPHERS